MSRMMALSMVGLVLCCVVTGCSTAPRGDESQQDMMVHAEGTLERFRASDPTLASRINEAYGFVVFPTIGMGGAGVGGAFGRGVVYEQGEAVGFASLTQATVGLQLGGQTYSELILFDRAAFDRFRTGTFSLGAQASAVAATAGAAANATFKDGVMVFTMGQTGLMYQATVGGQRLAFEPW